MAKPNQLMLLESLVRAGVITGATFTASRYVPKQLKWLAVFLIALNLRVFPTWWHGELSQGFFFVGVFTFGYSSSRCVNACHPALARILYPWFRMIWTFWFVQKRGGMVALNKHLSRVTKEFGYGKHPLDFVERLRLRAGENFKAHRLVDQSLKSS